MHKSSAENEVKYETDKTDKHSADPLFIFIAFSVLRGFFGSKEKGKDKESGGTDNRFRSTGNEEKRAADTETCRQRNIFQKDMEKTEVLLKE